MSRGVVAGLLANKPIRRTTNLLQSRYAHRSWDCSFTHIHDNKALLGESDGYGRCNKRVVTKTRTTKKKRQELQCWPSAKLTKQKLQEINESLQTKENLHLCH